MVSKSTYLSYWIHKVDQLWKEIEEIKDRLSIIEAKLGNINYTKKEKEEISQTNNIEVNYNTEKTIVLEPEEAAQIIKEENVGNEDPVIEILKTGPKSLVEINNLLKQKGIEESLRDTLFNRLKKLIQEQRVGFDNASQTFFLRNQ